MAPARSTVPRFSWRIRDASSHGPEAARRELEILAPEEIGVRGEEDADIDDGHEEEQQRREVDDEGQPGEAQAVEERASERQGPAHGILREIRALHHLGDVVEEIAGDDRRHRRQEVGERDEEPGAGQEEREAVEEGIAGADVVRLEPGVRGAASGRTRRSPGGPSVSASDFHSTPRRAGENTCPQALKAAWINMTISPA